MTEVYAASEEPLEGVSGRVLLEEVRRHGQRHTLYIADVEAIASELPPLLQENDLVLTLGAGNIVKVGEDLLLLLENLQR
jgi:UDP-N-acetylmuramate--alanine ligase